MKLPETFQDTFRRLLGEAEYLRFRDALSAERTWGLRVNTLRMDVPAYLARTRFALAPVPWTRDGFRHVADLSPGRHPDYHAGLYYLQDPSAMLPAELLDPKPGDRVLDLCAAPGGKSVQLAAMMRNTGFLLTNDISPKRVKPLRRNLEGLGVACAAVANETPARLAALFPEYFDAIVLDVPCSGEGMFRKDETAVRSWKRHDPAELQGIQRDILCTAWTMLRPGGRLVYSTCTFNPDENERNIAWAMARFPDMAVDPVCERPGGLAPGRSDWVDGYPELAGAVRIWPHLATGEGHFAIRLKKRGDAGPRSVPDRIVRQASDEAAAPMPDRGLTSGRHAGPGRAGKADRRHAAAHRGAVRETVPHAAFRPAEEEAMAAFRSFLAEEMVPDVRIAGSQRVLAEEGLAVLAGNALYLLGLGGCCPVDALSGLVLEMPGLYAGDWENGRFEPSSALLHALEAGAVKRRLDLPADSMETSRYLHGETLMRDGERGWTAVLVDGVPLGWGKQEEGFLKNRYPKGWRMQ